MRASLADQSLAIALGANLPSPAGDPIDTLVAVRPQLEGLVTAWWAGLERASADASSAPVGDASHPHWSWSPLFATAPVGGPADQPNYCNAVLVLEGGVLRGILSERDYTRKVMLQGRSSKTTTVREIMTAEVICVKPQHGVEETLRLVTENRVRHLPVKDAEGQVIGLISIGDLVKWVIHAQRSALSQLEAYVAGGYPG